MASRRLKSDRFFTDDYRPGDLHRVRPGLHQEELDADRAATSFPAARAGVVGSRERLRAVEGDQGARRRALREAEVVITSDEAFRGQLWPLPDNPLPKKPSIRRSARIADFIAFLKSGKPQAVTDRARPPVQSGRAAGCVHAQFTVLDTLAAEHRVGRLREPARRTRPGSALPMPRRNRTARRTSVGWPSGSPACRGKTSRPVRRSQDFVLNSHPVMVAPNTKDFLAVAEGDGGRRAAAGELLPVASTVGDHRVPGSPAADEPSRYFRTGARRRTCSVRAAR